jgi:hypothetical protein
MIGMTELLNGITNLEAFFFGIFNSLLSNL